MAAAHGGSHGSTFDPIHGIAFAALGLLVLGLVVHSKRTGRLSPTRALGGALFGLSTTVVGIVVFDGLAADPTYSASSMPFPRPWYRLLSLSVGLSIAVLSLGIGFVRWRSRPRYAFLGILLGTWVAYPAVIPGHASETHPFGYVLVLTTPVLVGYVVWTDAGRVLRAALRDPAARRFGIGVGLLAGFFFASISGYVSLFREAGAPHETSITVLPVVYQLVQWPTIEFAFPQIPLFGAVNPGVAIVVGTVSVLVGLNALLIARQWRLDEAGGAMGGAAGSGVVAGSCTCGCCGPLVAKVGVLVTGPAVAAPVYWLFADPASPLGPLFVLGSIVLFTGSLVYSVESVETTVQPRPIVPVTEP